VVPNSFIHIKAPKLCVLPGEFKELCNDGIYGKSLSKYLQKQLTALGYSGPRLYCEDWGWWLGVTKASVELGLCIYGFPKVDVDEESKGGELLDLCVRIDTDAKKGWSWKRFRIVDKATLVVKLFEELKEIFESDPDIEILDIDEEFPLG